MAEKEIRGLLKAFGGRLWRAAGYSLAGLRAAFENEAAFRQEVYLSLLLLPLGWWLG
ncbi:MAG: diacylglycerol kinase, partial [Deltaproteobacteria bacterium]|nr:diacylglycerol kinase [Deltaproteobacteria bacterium]